MDILGCVVEVISKMTFAEYLQKNIFDPLGLNSIGFSVNESDKDSLQLFIHQEHFLEMVKL